MNQKIANILKLCSDKTHVSYTKRANQAILAALKVAIEKGFKTLYIPESGGWMTYAQFGEKCKLTIKHIPTINEQIDYTKWKPKKNSIILLHSLAGYHTTIDTQTVREIADETQSLFIEDVCGTFGHLSAHGHIVLGSFGNAKPFNLGKGGFIATSDEDLMIQLQSHITNELTETDETILLKKLQDRTARFRHLFTIRNQLKHKLKKTTIGDENALVIIAPFNTESEAKDLISFCEENQVEYTKCPRYIRHNKPAISMEVKRL